VLVENEFFLRGSWVPSAPRLFDNGVEGNDQLYSPLFEPRCFECKVMFQHVLCATLLACVLWSSSSSRNRINYVINAVESDRGCTHVV
jgi:hypothetical protein